MSHSLLARTLVLVALLLSARQVVAGLDAVETPLHAPLAAFPLEIDGWRGFEGPEFAPEVVRTLGADEYVNRVYADQHERAAGLYIAYYTAQRHGDAIHSPQHCLPGTGWEPISRARVAIDAGTRGLTVNRYVVQKRSQRQLVLYWFEGRGRSVASEYANKLYLLSDSLTRGRTHGALVRVLTPIRGDERAADATAARFVRGLHPHLLRWLP
jgi:EpsI family protein